MKNLEKTISTKRPVFSGETVKSMFKNYTGKQVKTGLNSGFTLVELIIVITILAILATIAFISFKGYTLNARDGNRLATLNSLEKGLQLFQIKSGSYPDPDEKINIEASGTIISYQGVVGDNVSRNINMSKTPTDPLDNIKYVYSTNANKNKYQLLSYMEGTDYLSLVTQTYAEDLSTRNPKSIGNNVGIILETNNSLPTTTINTYSGSTAYKVLFYGTDSITGSGNTLFSNIYNRRDDLTKDKTFASLDDSLVGYWDMETTTISGTLTVLKDLSRYNNNGTCYNSGNIVNCNGVEGGPQIVDGNGKTGKAMSFDGVDDYISISYLNNTPIFNLSGDYSIITFGKTIKSLPSGLPSSKWYYQIFKKGSVPDIEFGYESFTNSISIKTYDSLNNSYSISKNATISNDGLMNIAFIKKSTISTLFLNGVKELNSNIASTSRMTINGNYYIGMGNAGYPYFNGTIDEIRIYNRALSDSEIRELYNATK